MASESSSHTGLIGVIVLLAVVVVAGLLFWQNDRESADLNIEIGAEDAETIVEPGTPLARGLSEGIGLSIA